MLLEFKGRVLLCGNTMLHLSLSGAELASQSVVCFSMFCQELGRVEEWPYWKANQLADHSLLEAGSSPGSGTRTSSLRAQQGRGFPVGKLFFFPAAPTTPAQEGAREVGPCGCCTRTTHGGLHQSGRILSLRNPTLIKRGSKPASLLLQREILSLLSWSGDKSAFGPKEALSLSPKAFAVKTALGK